MAHTRKSLKGVNLGGWLVVEKWITPSLFEGIDARDEFTLSKSREGRGRLLAHRQNFIQGSDFEWLAANGIDTIRLPVGYWIFGGEEPFIAALDQVDFAFAQAQKNNLNVILDLHGAPGSQNGNDHSGQSGKLGWLENDNIPRTLEVLEKLSAKYGQEESLLGIEVMNEPGWEISAEILEEFYKQAYSIIKKNSRESTKVIISDGFRPEEWFGRMPESEFPGLVIDMHLYQVFSEADRNLSLDGHISKARREWLELIRKMQESNPVIIGEWSVELQTKPEVFETDDKSCSRYGQAQLSSFNTSYGWFFWTYKTENRRYWSLRECLEGGVLERIV